MKIDKWYPDSRTFKSNELLTLAFFQNDSNLKEAFPVLADNAYQYYPFLKNARDTIFNFESELEIQINGATGKIRGKAHIGGKFFENRKKKLLAPSYYMAICETESIRHRLIRKYHFDYVLPDLVRRQPYPIFHLQSPGELSQHLSSLDFECDHMDTWLSEPRLFFMPMSLALLVNIVLKEFPDERTKKIAERCEWRDLIRKNENFLLAPYFRCCNLFLSGNKQEHLFTNDFCYGN